MDYFEEGDYCKRIFDFKSSMETFMQIISHVQDIGLKDASPNEKEEFIKGMLTGSTSKNVFDHASFVASAPYFESMWVTIIIAFNNINKDGKQVDWAKEFVEDTINNDVFKISSSQVTHLVTMLFNYGTESFLKFKDSPVFKEHNDAIKSELINQINMIIVTNPKIDVNRFSHITRAFKDISFYKALLKEIKEKQKHAQFILAVMQSIRLFGEEMGVSFSDINYMMQHYSEEIASLAAIINEVVGAIIKHGYDEESGQLLVDLLKKQKPNAVNMTMALQSNIAKIDLVVVKLHLFEVTGNVNYLPVDVKEMFAF